MTKKSSNFDAGDERSSEEARMEWLPTIAPEKVCELLPRIREFQAKVIADDFDTSSNPSDDGMRVILEDAPNDAVESELYEFIRGLNIDEQVDLVALAWLGRGDGGPEAWTTLRAEAARERSARAASYLLKIPMLSDYLADALAQFGQTCDDG